jgi:formylglycine-generating enzyme required for sulfatase activity
MLEAGVQTRRTAPLHCLALMLALAATPLPGAGEAAEPGAAGTAPPAAAPPAAAPPTAAPPARAVGDAAALEREGLVLIRGGSFRMGSSGSEAARNDDEGPVHTVRVHAFALGKYPVTRAEFAAFVTASGYQPEGACWVWQEQRFTRLDNADWRNPGFEQTDRDPAVCISWTDANAYASWLSRKSGESFRLPSEAEWEYAARAGTTTARFWGDSPDAACTYADVADLSVRRNIAGGERWTVHNCDDGKAYTAPVGSYRPNPWGLYDMLGNAWEWVEDCYHSDYVEAPLDGSAWLSSPCSQRVLRGGSWAGYPGAVRSALRLWFGPDIRINVIGFRVARSLP